MIRLPFAALAAKTIQSKALVCCAAGNPPLNFPNTPLGRMLAPLGALALLKTHAFDQLFALMFNLSLYRG